MRAIARTAGLMAIAAAALLPTSLVHAGDVGDVSARSARPVLICGTDDATRRAFKREHGSEPVFVTAREALSVRASDPVWSAPRCMTAREHARYRDATTTLAAAR